MTSVGHTLTGFGLATLLLPASERPLWRRPVLHLCAFAANVPDLPLPGWGHDRYEVSHSLFVTLALLAVLAAAPLASGPLRERLGGYPVLLAVSAAWFSHLLLDSLYSHGRGIGILWPLSDAHLALPVSWFHTLRLDPWAQAHNLRVLAVELAFYGPLLALCVLLRRRRVRR